MHRSYEVKGADHAWYRPKEYEMRYTDQLKDPIRNSPNHPEKEKYEMKEMLYLQIETNE